MGNTSNQKETGTWPAAWAALAELDDDAWDTDRLNERWKQEYRDAFVSFAMSRNWDRENPEVWCDEIVGDALMASRGADVTPRRQPRQTFVNVNGSVEMPSDHSQISPSDEEFRAAGYTGEARKYKLSEAGCRWIAEWNGVRPEQMPRAWRFAPNEYMRRYIEERAGNTTAVIKPQPTAVSGARDEEVVDPEPCPHCGKKWDRIGFMEWELTCECPA